MNVICINCKLENPEGMTLCSKCGAVLFITKKSDTSTLNELPDVSIEDLNIPPLPKLSDIGSNFGLYVLSHNKTIPLEMRKEYLIGRAIEGKTTVLPTIDLDSYDAYSKGVSRIHATISLKEENIHITDLDSSNGTYVNNVKLIPQQKFPLTYGNIIMLGTLKLQMVVYDDEPSLKKSN